MPQLALDYPHQLGQAEATERLKKLVEQKRVEHADKLGDMQGTWAGHVMSFAFSVMGMAVKGTMDVGPDRVSVNGNLPLAASFFRGQIEQAIRTELSNVLS